MEPPAWTSASPAPAWRQAASSGSAGIVWLALGAVFALAVVGLGDLSPTWIALTACALILSMVLAFSGRPTEVLFTGYIATVSIGITKGLVAGHGYYYPALSLALSDVFLLPLLALHLFDIMVRRRARFVGHPIVSAAAVWLGWQWFCALRAPILVDGLCVALNHTKYFLALWLLMNALRKPGYWRLLCRGAAIGVALHFAMSVLQIGSGGAIEIQGIAASNERKLSYASAGLLSLVRPSGLLSHPNQLALFLVLVLPAGVGLVLLAPGEIARRRWLWRATVGAALLMLVLTMSRGGWIALGLGLAGYLVLGLRRRVVRKVQIQRVLIASLAMVVLTLVALPGVYLRIVESDNRSTQSRVLLAQQAIAIIRTNPILGVGLSGYGNAALRNLPEAYGSIGSDFRKTLTHSLVHDKYLLVTAESGVIGLALFLNVFRVALVALWRTRAAFDRARQRMVLGLFGSVLGAMSVYLAEPAEMGVTLEMTWLVLGACAAASGLPSASARRAPWPTMAGAR